MRHCNDSKGLFFCKQDDGEDEETSLSLAEVSEVPLRDNTPLSSREMYRLSQRIVLDWDSLAGLMDITTAERDDIRYSCLYNNSRSRAEKILSIINNKKNLSREKLAACLKGMQMLDLISPIITGAWRSDYKCKILLNKLIFRFNQIKSWKTSSFYLHHKFLYHLI